MRISTLLIISLLLLSCKEQSNEKPIYSTAQQNITESTPPSTEVEKPKPIEILEKNFKNFTFKVPNNFELQENVSNSNKQVYVNAQENIGFTIDVEYLPSGFENKSIRTVVVDLNEFGTSINQNNRLNFSDFKLLKTTYADLGNAESVLVNQLSTNISGSKNIEMKVDSYFVISDPYYCSITFSYPRNSISSKNTVAKIGNSFKFKEIVKQEVQPISTSKREDPVYEKEEVERPSLFDTKQWILTKFKSYGHPDYTYKIEGWNLIIISSQKNYLPIEYTIPLCDINISQAYRSNMIQVRTNKTRIKIDKDYKGFPHYDSSFDFDLNYRSENNLISRLNDALDNLKHYCPNNLTPKETF